MDHQNPINLSSLLQLQLRKFTRNSILAASGLVSLSMVEEATYFALLLFVLSLSILSALNGRVPVIHKRGAHIGEQCLAHDGRSTIPSLFF